MQPQSPRLSRERTSLKKEDIHSPKKRNESHKLFVFTRFSIYNPELRGFGVFKGKFDDENEYKEYIYGDERMDEKFSAFMKLTVPSVLSQTYSNYEWLICTSKEMPVRYRKLLHKIVSDVPHTKVVYVKSISEFMEFCSDYPKEHMGTATGFTTMRLDDDDGLHPTFFQQVTEYRKPGSIISAAYGYKVSIKGEDAFASQNTFLPMCPAIGLSYVGGNVFRLGNHATIHERRKGVYFLPRRGNYLVYAGSATSTDRKQEKSAKPFSLENYFQMDRGGWGTKK